MHIHNRRAAYEYFLLDKIEAGLVLTGPEVKSVKAGRLQFEGSFIKERNGELWLFNANIPLYKFSLPENYDPSRPRKLLLHKNEILAIIGRARQKNLTLVPVSCYTKGRHGVIKLEVALARGKRKFEKKAAIKKREEIKKDNF